MEPRPAARLVFSPEAPIHARIAALKQWNRATRLVVLDQTWWRANPPAHSGGRWMRRAAGPPYRTREAARVMPGVQSIGTATPGDHFELIARQTSSSTKNVAAADLTWFALKVVE